MVTAMAQIASPRARYWVEFPDPATDPDQAPVNFRCDLTWLTSTWQCIFGAGCPGIVEGRPDDGCCTYGAHFTDAADAQRTARAAARLTPALWQHASQGRQLLAEHGSLWRFGADLEPGELATPLVDGACIFLNREGFPGGEGCALHHLARSSGTPLTQSKPEVCWQLPLRRSYTSVTAADGVSTQVVVIGEFDRASWGPGGHDLDWYCTWSQVAHSSPEPLFRRAKEELIALMGAAGYWELTTHAEHFLALSDPGQPGPR